MTKILIVGAASAIAKEVARLYAVDGAEIWLLARDELGLDTLRKDLVVRGASKVETRIFDALEFGNHRPLISSIFDEQKEGFDVALVAFGTLPNQELCQKNVEELIAAINLNGTATVSICEMLAERMESAGKGVLAVISSVAGDRGRQSNYIYGASKALVTAYLQGLRNRLYSKGVHVVTIKPGFVDTPMTHSFKKGFLWAQPEKVAADIKKAIEKRRDVLYTPAFWRVIMLIITTIPEIVFKRLRL